METRASIIGIILLIDIVAVILIYHGSNKTEKNLSQKSQGATK